MATVVCANEKCYFRNPSGFCTKDFISLNGITQCMEFFNKRGEAYMVPLYEIQREAASGPSDTEQKPSSEPSNQPEN